MIADSRKIDVLIRDGMQVIIRVRTEEDLDQCERLARIVHEIDGYPPYLPGDLRTFIGAGAITAWVAETSGEIVGHVALNQGSSPAVMKLASDTTGEPSQHLGVVARLLVSPSARRKGLGRSLLRTAASNAVHRGLRPILDVATMFEGAIRLYEACGWHRAGMITVRLGDEFTLDEYVYLAPIELD